VSLIRRALWALALALVAGILIVNAMVSYRNTLTLAKGAAASAHSRDVLNAIDDLQLMVTDAETGQRGYLLTQRAPYLAPYESAIHDATSRLGDLKALIADNAAQLQRLAKVELQITQKFEELRHTIDLDQSGHRAEALEMMATDQGMHLMRDIRGGIDAMRSAEYALQLQRDDAASQAYSVSQFNRIVGMLVGLGLVLLAVILLRRDLRIRERAAREIHLQREWFSTTLRSIGDAVIVTDPQGRVQLINPVAEQMTGWSNSAAVGRPLREVFDIINEETREPAEDPVERALREGRIVGLANHTVLRSRDGREYVIEDSAAPTYDNAGTVQGAVMVFHDSSLRRQAEVALSMATHEVAQRANAALAAERTLTTILDNAPIGICMTGPAPDFPFVVISRQMREWIGAAENMPALAAYRKLLPDGREPPPDLIPLNRVMHHGQFVHDEPWLIERKARPPLTVIVNVAPVRDADGVIVGAIHSWVDLTERQRLDHELRVMQSRLRVLVEANVIGLILSFDRAGNVTQANSAFLDMLGFEYGDVVGNRVNLIAQTPPEFAEADQQAFLELAQAGYCAPYEKELLRKDGSRVVVVVGYTKVIDADDEFVGFALDISARKTLERKLREQAQTLLTADRRKDEFLAMLAHELRNPLAPLRNAAHLLDTERGREPAFLANLVPAMRRQIDQLVRLVDDLLDAARISQGKIIIEHATVELAQSLHAAIESVQPLIQARGHHLVLDICSAPLYVDGDAARLTQMIANVVHNAAKYTQNGGHIRVELGAQGQSAVLRVRDDGQGITPDLLPRIFDAFIQADQSLARSAGGLGVGLALVRKLCELHGGTVTAASAGLGLGSEFELRLPLVAAPQKTATPEPQSTANPANSIAQRVLVVDDNADLAASTAALLGLWGHEVSVVHNGRYVLGTALSFKPAVVLLDIGLPGMDGFEVARQIRATEALTGVRLIAITGYGQEHDIARARDVGFDAHMVKPVQPEALKAIIETAQV
jgi:PAS domain S-box-containing protein